MGNTTTQRDWSDDDDWVRGVRRVSAKGTSKKILKQFIRTYTQEEAERYLKILEGVKSGKIGASKLEKVAQYFKQ